MLYRIRWIIQLCSEKFGIHLNVLVERDPTKMLLAVIFREAFADRRKGIRYFHIEEKRDL